jgi:hypothetical protein
MNDKIIGMRRQETEESNRLVRELNFMLPQKNQMKPASPEIMEQYQAFLECWLNRSR